MREVYRRKRRGQSGEPRTGNSVCPDFVRRKLLGYALNMIQSPLLKDYAEVAFDLMSWLAGGDELRRVFQKSVSRKDPALAAKFSALQSSKEGFDYPELSGLLGKNCVAKIMGQRCPRILKKHLKKIAESCPVKSRLDALSSTFRLTVAEQEILSFLYCLGFYGDLRELYSCPTHVAERYSFALALGQLSGLGSDKIRAALKSARLQYAQLVDLDRTTALAEAVGDFLSGVSEDVSGGACQKFKGKALALESHLIDELSLSILTGFLTGSGGKNILFYGEPGTGKTELAKSLAARCGKDLYMMSVTDGQDTDDLKRAIAATHNGLDSSKSIIVVDEADRILNSSFSFFFSGERNQKSWTNQFMDQTPHKVIWITNQSDFIDPSTMRRFDYSIKFDRFNIKKRRMVFQHCLAQKGLEDYFTEEELTRLCARYSINAGGIAAAVRNLKIRRTSGKALVMKKLEAVLQNHQTAITGNDYKGNQIKGLGRYNLSALNTSGNLPSLVAGLKENLSAHGVEGGFKNLNILLYGPPGTGKTEFVKFLAQTLQKELVFKRASDLQSCWVGETEKLVARAFKEAAGSDCVLFLDEADTFFYARESATRAWERSQTNEILTQMENFNGILICATNFIDGLDKAALRRFKFKIEFKPLNPDGVMEMYKTTLNPLLPGLELSPEESQELRGFQGVTPGDFHVAAEKFSIIKPANLTHRILIDTLAEELRFKPKTRSIGFAV